MWSALSFVNRGLWICHSRSLNLSPEVSGFVARGLWICRPRSLDLLPQVSGFVARSLWICSIIRGSTRRRIPARTEHCDPDACSAWRMRRVTHATGAAGNAIAGFEMIFFTGFTTCYLLWRNTVYDGFSRNTRSFDTLLWPCVISLCHSCVTLLCHSPELLSRFVLLDHTRKRVTPVRHPRCQRLLVCVILGFRAPLWQHHALGMQYHKCTIGGTIYRGFESIARGGGGGERRGLRFTTTGSLRDRKGSDARELLEMKCHILQALGRKWDASSFSNICFYLAGQ